MPRDDPFAQNVVLSFGHALSLAAHRRDKLSILDWGGAVGHYYELARRLVPDVHFDYHCAELPSVCAVGRDLVPEVTFHEDDTCLDDRRYDFVFVSGSLQYVEDWAGQLRRLAAAAESWLFITRVLVVDRVGPLVVLQRAHGYNTELVTWVFNRDELVQSALKEHFELVREYTFGPGAPASGNRTLQTPTWAGLLMRRAPAG